MTYLLRAGAAKADDGLNALNQARYNVRKALGLEPEYAIAGGGYINSSPEETSYFKNQISKITGKGKSSSNKNINANNTKRAAKALDDIVNKYSDDIYKYNYKEGVYKPTEITTRNYDKLDEIAEEMYDSFREISDDVEKIANNIGWDIKDINQIKEHVFLDEVLKDSGMGRLDPDYEMAMAWERLCKGEFYDNDILLLKHELYESTYYRMNKCTQRQAHDVTTEIFDWNGYVESLR
ncbi:hypothetical protein [Clostridium lundense]|uniref:hypothetical protein n=1 Tax=Clostridium lundense TaxID=319475 RepID=UPI000686C7B6|nr:hypothetical protein [Clostridium lundense]